VTPQPQQTRIAFFWVHARTLSAAGQTASAAGSVRHRLPYRIAERGMQIGDRNGIGRCPSSEHLAQVAA